MGKEIVIESIFTHQVDRETISLDQWRIKRERRRKRVARRMARRFPLFAVEFVGEEFSGYTQDLFEADVAGAKLPKKRKGKSQLRRQGRFPLMQEALFNYRRTKDVQYLYEAQQWRKKMYLHFEVVFSLRGERQVHTFPSTTPEKLILELGKITFTSWEELQGILAEKLRWIHVS